MLPTPKNRPRTVRVVCLAAVCLLAAGRVLDGPIVRADPNWSTMPYTAFHVMQDVDSSGNPTWSVPTWPPTYDPGYKLRGVVLNNPADMLDSTPNYQEGPLWYMGGQWQVFIQAVSLPGDDVNHPELVGDYGGSALWMGQNYGNHVWHYPNYSYSYSNTAWTAEMVRLNWPIDINTGQPVTEPLRAGDVIEVHARGGLHYKGKFNCNEQHDNDPALNFDLFVLQRDYPLAGTPITLATLKDASNQWLLEPDTVPVAEHYQATLVTLQGVSVSDPQNWAPEQTVTLTDGQGRTMPMLIGRNPGFGSTAPAGTFDVTAIFDQDSTNLKSGYRLWVMDPGQFGFVAQVPEPGAMLLAVCGLVFAVASARGRFGREA